MEPYLSKLPDTRDCALLEAQSRATAQNEIELRSAINKRRIWTEKIRKMKGRRRLKLPKRRRRSEMDDESTSSNRGRRAPHASAHGTQPSEGGL